MLLSQVRICSVYSYTVLQFCRFSYTDLYTYPVCVYRFSFFTGFVCILVYRRYINEINFRFTCIRIRSLAHPCILIYGWPIPFVFKKICCTLRFLVNGISIPLVYIYALVISCHIHVWVPYSVIVSKDNYLFRTLTNMLLSFLRCLELL